MCLRQEARAGISRAVATPPGAVYLREDTIRDAVNEWFAELFDRDHVDATVAAFVASQEGPGGRRPGETRRNIGSSRRRRRFGGSKRRSWQGIDPMALVEVINTAQADQQHTRAEPDGSHEVYARIDSLGDVPATLSRGSRERSATSVAGHDVGDGGKGRRDRQGSPASAASTASGASTSSRA